MIGKINWRAFFASTIAVLISVMATIFVANKVGDWSGFREATAIATGRTFGELFHAGGLIQPWNTVSSYAYVFVGIYILFLPLEKRLDQPISILGNFWMRFIFCFSVIITGLGSGFYHMSWTFIGQTFDVVGMYLISTFIILYVIFRYRKISAGRFLLYFAILNLLLLIPLIFSPELRRNLFFVLILIGLLLEFFMNRKKAYYSPDMLYAAASSLGIAFIVWNMDNEVGLFFSTTGFWQGHVIWHILGAAACGLIFLYYRKEDTKKRALEQEAEVSR